MKLKINERIIAVVPETCSGPGWLNTVIWVYIHDTVTQKLRQECLQPSEQPRDAKILFNSLEALHQTMLDVIKSEIDYET